MNTTTLSCVNLSTFTKNNSKEGLCTCNINDSRFTIFYKNIDEKKGIKFDCEDHTLIILSNIKANKISIIAKSVIILGNIISNPNELFIDLTGKLIFLERTSSDDHIFQQRKDRYFLIDLIEERFDSIIRLFNEGIEEENGENILKAMEGIYGAIVNPNHKGNEIDAEMHLKNTCEFFEIPLKVKNWLN